MMRLILVRKLWNRCILDLAIWVSIIMHDPSGLPDGRGVVDMTRNVFQHCAGVSIVADAKSRGRGTRPCTSIVIKNQWKSTELHWFSLILRISTVFHWICDLVNESATFCQVSERRDGGSRSGNDPRASTFPRPSERLAISRLLWCVLVLSTEMS